MRKFNHTKSAWVAIKQPDGWYGLTIEGHAITSAALLPPFVVENSAEWMEIKEKEPLFMTYSGIGIYEGDQYYAVYTEPCSLDTWIVYGPLTAAVQVQPDGAKIFQTPEEAHDYVAQNKPKDAATEFYNKRWPPEWPLGYTSVGKDEELKLMRDFANQQCQPLRDEIEKLKKVHVDFDNKCRDIILDSQIEQRRLRDRIAELEEAQTAMISAVEEGADRKWTGADMIKYAKECAKYIRQNGLVYYEGALYSFIESRRSKQE